MRTLIIALLLLYSTTTTATEEPSFVIAQILTACGVPYLINFYIDGKVYHITIEDLKTLPRLVDVFAEELMRNSTSIVEDEEISYEVGCFSS